MKRAVTIAKLNVASLLLLSCLAANAQCNDNGHELLLPLVGNWDEYVIEEEGKRHIGTLSTTLVSGNCAVAQQFVSPDGSFSFNSLGYIGSDGTWTETYVFSNARIATYSWRKEGAEIILQQLVSEDEPARRLRIYSISRNSYFVSTEESIDGGKSWTRLDLVKTVRKVPSSSS